MDTGRKLRELPLPPAAPGISSKALKQIQATIRYWEAPTTEMLREVETGTPTEAGRVLTKWLVTHQSKASCRMAKDWGQAWHDAFSERLQSNDHLDESIKALYKNYFAPFVSDRLKFQQEMTCFNEAGFYRYVINEYILKAERRILLQEQASLQESDAADGGFEAKWLKYELYCMLHTVQTQNWHVQVLLRQRVNLQNELDQIADTLKTLSGAKAEPSRITELTNNLIALDKKIKDRCEKLCDSLDAAQKKYTDLHGYDEETIDSTYARNLNAVLTQDVLDVLPEREGSCILNEIIKLRNKACEAQSQKHNDILTIYIQELAIENSTYTKFKENVEKCENKFSKQKHFIGFSLLDLHNYRHNLTTMRDFLAHYKKLKHYRDGSGVLNWIAWKLVWLRIVFSTFRFRATFETLDKFLNHVDEYEEIYLAELEAYAYAIECRLSLLSEDKTLTQLDPTFTLHETLNDCIDTLFSDNYQTRYTLGDTAFEMSQDVLSRKKLITSKEAVRSGDVGKRDGLLTMGQECNAEIIVGLRNVLATAKQELTNFVDERSFRDSIYCDDVALESTKAALAKKGELDQVLLTDPAIQLCYALFTDHMVSEGGEADPNSEKELMRLRYQREVLVEAIERAKLIIKQAPTLDIKRKMHRSVRKDVMARLQKFREQVDSRENSIAEEKKQHLVASIDGYIASWLKNIPTDSSDLSPARWLALINEIEDHRSNLSDDIGSGLSCDWQQYFIDNVYAQLSEATHFTSSQLKEIKQNAAHIITDSAKRDLFIATLQVFAGEISFETFQLQVGHDALARDKQSESWREYFSNSLRSYMSNMQLTPKMCFEKSLSLLLSPSEDASRFCLELARNVVLNTIAQSRLKLTDSEGVYRLHNMLPYTFCQYYLNSQEISERIIPDESIETNKVAYDDKQLVLLTANELAVILAEAKKLDAPISVSQCGDERGCKMTQKNLVHLAIKLKMFIVLREEIDEVKSLRTALANYPFAENPTLFLHFYPLVSYLTDTDTSEYLQTFVAATLQAICEDTSFSANDHHLYIARNLRADVPVITLDHSELVRAFKSAYQQRDVQKLAFIVECARNDTIQELATEMLTALISQTVEPQDALPCLTEVLSTLSKQQAEAFLRSCNKSLEDSWESVFKGALMKHNDDDAEAIVMGYATQTIIDKFKAEKTLQKYLSVIHHTQATYDRSCPNSLAKFGSEDCKALAVQPTCVVTLFKELTDVLHNYPSGEANRYIFDLLGLAHDVLNQPALCTSVDEDTYTNLKMNVELISPEWDMKFRVQQCLNEFQALYDNESVTPEHFADKFRHLWVDQRLAVLAVSDSIKKEQFDAVLAWLEREYIKEQQIDFSQITHEVGSMTDTAERVEVAGLHIKAIRKKITPDVFSDKIKETTINDINGKLEAFYSLLVNKYFRPDKLFTREHVELLRDHATKENIDFVMNYVNAKKTSHIALPKRHKGTSSLRMSPGEKQVFEEVRIKFGLLCRQTSHDERDFQLVAQYSDFVKITNLLKSICKASDKKAKTATGSRKLAQTPKKFEPMTKKQTPGSSRLTRAESFRKFLQFPTSPRKNNSAATISHAYTPKKGSVRKSVETVFNDPVSSAGTPEKVKRIQPEDIRLIKSLNRILQRTLQQDTPSAKGKEPVTREIKSDFLIQYDCSIHWQKHLGDFIEKMQKELKSPYTKTKHRKHLLMLKQVKQLWPLIAETDRRVLQTKLLALFGYHLFKCDISDSDKLIQLQELKEALPGLEDVVNDLLAALFADGVNTAAIRSLRADLKSIQNSSPFSESDCEITINLESLPTLRLLLPNDERQELIEILKKASHDACNEQHKSSVQSLQFFLDIDDAAYDEHSNVWLNHIAEMTTPERKKIMNVLFKKLIDYLEPEKHVSVDNVNNFFLSDMAQIAYLTDLGEKEVELIAHVRSLAEKLIGPPDEASKYITKVVLVSEFTKFFFQYCYSKFASDSCRNLRVDFENQFKIYKNAMHKGEGNNDALRKAYNSFLCLYMIGHDEPCNDFMRDVNSKVINEAPILDARVVLSALIYSKTHSSDECKSGLAKTAKKISSKWRVRPSIVDFQGSSLIDAYKDAIRTHYRKPESPRGVKRTLFGPSSSARVAPGDSPTETTPSGSLHS